MGYYTKAKHKECIIEMREMFGDFAVFCFCLCNAYKYLYRAGLKQNNPAPQDYEKSQWYVKYARDLQHKHKYNIIYYLFKIDRILRKAAQ